MFSSKDVAVREANGDVVSESDADNSKVTVMSVPNVANVNINKSSKVQIGPKFVTVTQNIQNAEMVTGRWLCADLVSGPPPVGLRCGFFVFVCWAILVATTLIVYFVFVTIPNQKTRLDLGLDEEWYIRRDEWQAMPAYAVEFFDVPVPYVIIGHSGGTYCNEKYSCIREILNIQKSHLRREFYDIGPNFLVGGNGYIFEGRGANVLPAMVSSWNTKSVMIMFLGNYQQARVDKMQLEHVSRILEILLKEEIITEDYIMYGHCQVKTQIISPGAHLLAQMPAFAHWNSANLTTCLSI